MKTMSSFRHLFPFFLTVGVLLWAPVVVADIRPGIDCTCSEDNGTYQQGAKAKQPILDCVPPINPDYCSSPNDRYRVTAAGSSQITLTVKTSGGQTVLTTEPFPFADAYWGFSPDDDRFVLHYYTAQGIDAVVHIRLYNIVGVSPDTPVYTDEFVIGHATAPLFSPHGNYLLYVNVTGTNHTLLRAANARTGAVVYEVEFDYAVPVDGDPFPDFPEIEKWGGVAWGFSPDVQDGSFVYVWMSNTNVVEWNLVNLVGGNLVRDITSNAAGVEWEFSPCGDVTAYIENRIIVWLYSTSSGSELAKEDFTPSVIQDNGIRSTSDSHEALVGGTYHLLASNTAHDDCPGGPDKDADGVPDAVDNCPDTPNFDQADDDEDGIGNACDPDFDSDGDGVMNDVDNCLLKANPDQADPDNDGVGSACDNCPDIENPDQADSDDNGVGDACQSTDISPPAWPPGSTLNAINIEETSLTLAWTAAEDNEQVTAYLIFQNESFQQYQLIAEIQGDIFTYSVTGLSPSKTYAFKIEARDAAGNLSIGGPSTFMSTPDNTSPTWPPGSLLEVTAVDESSITLQWTDASDNAGITNYRIYWERPSGSPVLLAQLPGSVKSYRVSCLESMVYYGFKVEAGDAAGNWSDDGPYVLQRTDPGPACDIATERVSVSSTGEQMWVPEGPGNTGSVKISADGRYVVFTSNGYNLVTDKTTAVSDVYVHDRHTGQTTRESLSSSGNEANAMCHTPFSGDRIGISDDGSFVTFASYASNLVLGDTNGKLDVFVRDRVSGTTERVSISSAGHEGSGGTIYGGYGPAVSAAGRYVAFCSDFTNLVDGDTNSTLDIFVRDRLNDMTERVSVSSAGQQGNSYSIGPAISSDGRFVAFRSWANNLVPDDTNNSSDIFVRDRVDGVTERVSISSMGAQASGGDSIAASISADGRYVAFASSATNLVPDDTNQTRDVFVHDREIGKTIRVSVSSSGEQGNMTSCNYVGYQAVGISANGRFVAFDSSASNLVPDDSNEMSDTFVHDRIMGTTIRVSICPCGDEGNSASIGPAISGNGRLVGFTSHANNLLEGLGDTNNAYDIFIYELPLANACEADYDGDGDVDGIDLAEFAESQFNDSDLERFAAEFGSINCQE